MVGLILRYRLFGRRFQSCSRLVEPGSSRSSDATRASLMYDDANFALAAKAVADTGLAFGNQGWMTERGDFS